MTGRRPRAQPGVPGAASPEHRKVFVVGCARSGTTWIRAILDQHPMVVTGPESHLLPVLGRALRSGPPSTTWKREVLTAYDQRERDAEVSYGGTGPHRWIDRRSLEGLLDAEIDAAHPTDVAVRAVVRGVLDGFYAAAGGQPGGVLVEKTPRHLFFAADLLASWPDAQIVEVVRDGRDVCVSLEHKSQVRDWAPEERLAQIRQWTRAVRTGLEARAQPAARASMARRALRGPPRPRGP